MAAIAAAVVATGTSAVRTIRTLQRKPTEERECRTWDRSCVLKIGKGFTLSTFDAQGVADMLNSSEESVERMANTKVRMTGGGRLGCTRGHDRVILGVCVYCCVMNVGTVLARFSVYWL